MLDNDLAKQSIKEDKLDFGFWAQSVARSLAALHHEEGFVVGIEGEWGAVNPLSLILSAKR